MTAWRNVTEAELRARGLVSGHAAPAPAVPARPAAGETARAGRGRKAPKGSLDVHNVFVLALHEKFPGMFRPEPSLGFQWANWTYRLAIQWGGMVCTPAHAGWVIMPVWRSDLETHKGVFSERMLRDVLRRIEELLG